MPLKKYFKGKGAEVMKSMKKQYGEKKGESVFYATANKQGMAPKRKKKAKKEKGGVAMKTLIQGPTRLDTY